MICVECGDDEASHSYQLCSDCLEVVEEPLTGHTRHPADQDDRDVSRERDERSFT